MSINGNNKMSTYDTTFPSTSSTSTIPPRSFKINGFLIKTQKLPILKAEPIEQMTKSLGITPPEMIFGNNFVSIEHTELPKWGIKFDSFGALNRVDKTGEKRLKVAYSKEWHQSREDNHDIKEVIKPFDWSYTTDYKGDDLYPESFEFNNNNIINNTTENRQDEGIPMELLKKPDPILFFDDVILYEDELADNGITMLSCKIRVMPERLLLLCRFFMRLDNVLIRLRDTRVYIDFQQKQIIREYLSKEKDYDTIRQELASRRGRGTDDVASVLRDPNQLVNLLPVVERKLEKLYLKT